VITGQDRDIDNILWNKVSNEKYKLAGVTKHWPDRQFSAAPVATPVLGLEPQSWLCLGIRFESRLQQVDWGRFGDLKSSPVGFLWRS